MTPKKSRLSPGVWTVLCLLLALCLTLSLTACGSKADTSANAADGSQTDEADVHGAQGFAHR